jgi:hypothetical protein
MPSAAPGSASTLARWCSVGSTRRVGGSVKMQETEIAIVIVHVGLGAQVTADAPGVGWRRLDWRRGRRAFSNWIRTACSTRRLGDDVQRKMEQHDVGGPG